MSTMSAFPAEEPRRARRGALVWDAPTRVFHWLMVLSFAGAYLTAESERWRLVHVTLGYTMAGLVVFRLAWGLIGTRHARFASFVRGPRAVARYLESLLERRAQSHVGHNPAGAIAIVALLVLAVAVTASGWAILNELGGHGLEEVHEALASGMLAMVGVHIAGVIVSSWLHRENLVASMVSGRKPVPPEEGIRSARRAVAAIVLASVLGFWWTQWQDAPTGVAARAASAGHAHHARHDD